MGCCSAPTRFQVGSPAPGFRAEALVDGEFKHLSLQDYEGKWVVLFFYPLDFTFVCPTEIKEFNEASKDFAALGAQVIGISVDSVYSHQAWAKDLGDLHIPLLSDMTKEISTKYGVLLEDLGIALRGTFIIDPDGILRAQIVHDLPVGRSVKETLRVVHSLQTGELCPVGWEPGQETLGKA
jgi:peroxiredoxin 2/4